jgi:hypothetical protein
MGPRMGMQSIMTVGIPLKTAAKSRGKVTINCGINIGKKVRKEKVGQL